MKYKVQHFKLGEFVCPDCGQVHISAGLVLLLDMARIRAGVPLRISSGFRCAKHNKDVGGVDNSRHLLGLAADIPLPPALVFSDVERILRPLFPTDAGYECKCYMARAYFHVAVPRGEPDEWTGGDIVIRGGLP